MKKIFIALSLIASFVLTTSCSSDPRASARHYNERINNASNLTELSYATKSMRDYYSGLSKEEKEIFDEESRRIHAVWTKF